MNPSIVTASEREAASDWLRQEFQGPLLPFSFVYNGSPSPGILPTWKHSRVSRRLDQSRTEHSLTWTEKDGGLIIRCVIVEYHDYPIVEWTLYFRNDGPEDTPILAQIQVMDTVLSGPAHGDFVLHYQNGSFFSAEDYRPFETVLEPGAAPWKTSSTGRCCDPLLPYFNLAWEGGGVILAVGWPGSWSASFGRNENDQAPVHLGQSLTHFRLYPGEEVRTPLIAALHYEGDWIRGQNVWRRWMLAHNLPRPGGALPPAILATAAPEIENLHYHEEHQVENLDLAHRRGMKYDYWWIDAGWYLCGGDWWNTGTWDEDPAQFPSGLRSFVQRVHACGMKQVLWFEPERVTQGSKWAVEHPDWMLQIIEEDGMENHNLLLDLGIPEAREMVLDMVSSKIAELGLDCYRQDFNLDPLPYWRATDAPDRQGITEIGHVTGYLTLWDELRRRFPTLLIDSCASGGRRNDLETLRRAVPLLQSDYRFEPIGTQGHNYGAPLWMPYHGTGGPDVYTPYNFRSHMGPCLATSPQIRGVDNDFALYHKLLGEWRLIAPYFLGDYYPVTPHSLQSEDWVAWQYDRPDTGEGVVFAFRRPDCSATSITLKLRGINPDARYALKDLDRPGTTEGSGHDLLEEGFTVALAEAPASAVILYGRVVSDG